MIPQGRRMIHEAAPVPAPPTPLRVLVVDDSRMQRRILAAQLSLAGYQVTEAASAEEALRWCRQQEPDIVLSDWLMPGMSGVEFCRIFRRMERERYGYFVLLTSKTEKHDVTRGLESGADDFLAKPVDGEELRARLSAGRRILAMERELKEKNLMLTSALDELQGLYDTLDRDLMEACKLQQSLVQERQRSFGAVQVSLMLHPCGRVGGDLVGFFPITAWRIGVYGIDVSGHGITSALMAARVCGYLSGSSPEQNIALTQAEHGVYDARDPADLAACLNRLTLEEVRTDSYFTLVYADVDVISGRVRLVQAGHPMPMILRGDGRIETVGQGGLPIGLIAEARWETVEIDLRPGDRLLLGSDGLSEATSPTGEILGEAGLMRMMKTVGDRRGADFLESLRQQTEAYAGGHPGDDVSAVLLEFGG